jgi:uncharacterized membrane protein YbhN (UPF0104 family)
METVSSSLTFLYKFIFVTVWSGGFGLGTVAMFLSPKPEAMRWQFAAAWAIGTAFLLPLARLKRVKLDGATLVISNYRRDITVPVSEIADARQNLFLSPRPVTITFRKETPFGNAVTFMPRASFRLFSEDDIVTRLRSLAGPRSEH